MHKFAMIMGVSALLFCSSVQAEDRALQNALAKAQYMLRQITAEKQGLERQLHDKEEQLELLKQESESKLAAREKASAKLGDKLALYNEKYSELQARYLDLLSVLRQQQADNESWTRRWLYRRINSSNAGTTTLIFIQLIMRFWESIRIRASGMYCMPVSRLPDSNRLKWKISYSIIVSEMKIIWLMIPRVLRTLWTLKR